MIEDLENILYNIINGYYTIVIDNKIYKIVYPNILIKHKAYNIYLKSIEDNKYDVESWISDLQIKNLLDRYNLWNDDLENQLKTSLNNLNNTKIELYQNFINIDIRLELKKIIKDLNNSINELYKKKYYFDYLSLEFYTQNIKNQYLICNMIYGIDNEKIFDYDNFDNIDSMFLDKILTEIHANYINSTTIKKLARSEIWRSFWNISKEKVFPGNIIDWTDDQKSLVNFTKMLDSIREHMECPSEEVLTDDDALDGWIFYQNDKNEKEKKKKQISEKFKLDDKKAGEVFLVTKNKKEIYNLNDNQTNRDIKEMIDITQKNGTVKWADLPHVKRDLQQQLRSTKK